MWGRHTQPAERVLRAAPRNALIRAGCLGGNQIGIGRFLARCVALVCVAAAAPLAAQVAAPPLEAYGELPAIEGVALSPEGSKIAVLVTVGGERMLAVFDEAMNPLRRPSWPLSKREESDAPGQNRRDSAATGPVKDRFILSAYSSSAPVRSRNLTDIIR